MKRKIAAATFAAAALLTLTAQPALPATEFGKDAYSFCMANSGRTVEQCVTYAAELDTYLAQIDNAWKDAR